MKIQNIISQIKELENKLKKAMDEREEQNIQMYNITENEAKVYFDNVKKKEQKIRERINELEIKKEEVSASIKSVQPLLVSATALGKEAEIDNIQKRLAEMRTNELAIDEQISMLETAEINGEQSLYEAVSENHDKLIDDSSGFSALWAEINSLAYEQEAFWKSIERITSSYVGPMNIPITHGKQSTAAEKVENHYNKNGDVINSNEIERSPDARNIETFRRDSYE